MSMPMFERVILHIAHPLNHAPPSSRMTSNDVLMTLEMSLMRHLTSSMFAGLLHGEDSTVKITIEFCNRGIYNRLYLFQ